MVYRGGFSVPVWSFYLVMPAVVHDFQMHSEASNINWNTYADHISFLDAIDNWTVLLGEKLEFNRLEWIFGSKVTT